jgi:actin-like ATPase involved in cell morphogenesis
VVIEVVRHDLQVEVGQRHAKKLRLSAGIAAREVGVAEDAGRGLTEGKLAEMRIRVGVVAAAIELAAAEEALAAA